MQAISPKLPHVFVLVSRFLHQRWLHCYCGGSATCRVNKEGTRASGVYRQKQDIHVWYPGETVEIVSRRTIQRMCAERARAETQHGSVWGRFWAANQLHPDCFNILLRFVLSSLLALQQKKEVKGRCGAELMEATGRQLLPPVQLWLMTSSVAALAAHILQR